LVGPRLAAFVARINASARLPLRWAVWAWVSSSSTVSAAATNPAQEAAMQARTSSRLQKQLACGPQNEPRWLRYIRL